MSERRRRKPTKAEQNNTINVKKDNNLFSKDIAAN